MLPIAQATKILLHCEKNAQSVSEILAKLGARHETIIVLIKELEARGLVRVMPRKHGVGRPKHLLRTTPLGKQFTEQYHKLLDVRLYSNDNDIKKALKHAEQTRRLVEAGVDLYVRFQEVNEIARNIANTAQTGRHP